VFDRSAPLPTGGHLDQADGTAWMALYCQNLLEIAIELATANPVYVEQAQTLFEHFAWIAVAMNRIGADKDSLWDEEDGFFYDLLRLPDGGATRLKVRSLVGLIPLAATSVIGGPVDGRFPELVIGAREFIQTSSSGRTASARCPGTTPRTRTPSGSTTTSTASATCLPSPTAGCSVATPTGADRCGSRSTCC
jgi:hypothetical protein